MSELKLKRREIWLHWIVGVGMLMMLGVGNYIEKAEAKDMIPTHKSVGIVLFFFIIWRVLLRIRKGWPQNVSTGAAWEHKLARIIHWVLILGTIIMPLSGILGSIFAGQGLSVFGLNIVGPNMVEGAARPEAISKAAAQASYALHGITSKVLILAVLLHVAGALKHHFIDRDNTLRRMLGMGMK